MSKVSLEADREILKCALMVAAERAAQQCRDIVPGVAQDNLEIDAYNFFLISARHRAGNYSMVDLEHLLRPRKGACRKYGLGIKYKTTPCECK